MIACQPSYELFGSVVVVAMLVLVVGVRFLGVVLVGVRVLVVGALLPSSLLPPPSSAAVSVQRLKQET